MDNKFYLEVVDSATASIQELSRVMGDLNYVHPSRDDECEYCGNKSDKRDNYGNCLGCGAPRPPARTWPNVRDFPPGTAMDWICTT